MTNGSAAVSESSIRPPLRVAPDMSPSWSNVDDDFDTAAQKIVEAHQRDGAATDLPIADLKTWAVAAHHGELALVPLARHHAPKPLRGNAFSALMQRLGAPAEFVRDKLPAPLQIATANWLLAAAKDAIPATLRLRGDEVSAIVSGRYAPLDPADLLQAVRDALVRFGLLKDVRVRGVASGLVDNLRIILPGDEAAVKVGDLSHVGIDISTSSFGRSAIHLSPVVWRLVCLNGMRAPEHRGQLSFRHVGEVERLRTGIAEAIPIALVHARGVMDQWKKAVNFMVDDVAKQIEELRELTGSERKTLEEEVKRETHVSVLPERTTVFDFVNAMTSAAKSTAPARRLELETLAGDVLQRHVGAGA